MRSNNLMKWACAAALLGDLSSAAAASESPPQNAVSAGIERCVRHRVTQTSFSGVISLAHNGAPSVVISNGVRSGPGSPPISGETRFNLGSASKMFTAVAVAQLVDAGRLAWTDPVGRYVTGLTPEASAVTVQQLVTHTSGLGDFFQPQNMAAMMRARTASDLLPLIAGEVPAFAPGSRFAYSNSGFALLGILIERVTHQSYGDYLREHIFRPAGMQHSGLDPRPLETLAVGMTAMGTSPEGDHGPLLVAPPPKGGRGPGGAGGMVLIGPGGAHVSPGSGRLRPAPGSTEGYGSPAGGLFSTAADMQSFFRALAANRLTFAQSTAALTSPQVVAAPAAQGQPARTYGYGFGTGSVAGHRWFGHNGGTLGANTELTVFPDDQWAVVVTSNRDPPSGTQMFRYVRDLLLHPQTLATCGGDVAPT